MSKIYFQILFVLTTGSVFSQDIHSSLQLRNNHLWRGNEVAAGLIYTGDLQLSYKNIYGGFWSGGNTNATYKEFNNFIGFKAKKLTLELWDIYNFSPGATYNNKEFFNYNAKETGRFWDFRSYYTISEKVPLTLSWNTVVFGRDRYSDNSENKYSTFVFGEYPLYNKKGIDVKGRVGYSFALHQEAGAESNFFSSKPGINEVSLILSKDLVFQELKFPIGIWCMWNPVSNDGYLQFSVQLYSF
jgi:hypothetical protein